MVPKLLALSLPLLLASLAFSSSTLPSSCESEEQPPDFQLVQLRGRFVGITATNKRHQSYIFEFRVSEQRNGPGQQPTAKDQLLRFERFEAGGEKALLAKLGFTEHKKLADFVRDLPKAPRFDVVFWLSPRDALIVGVPVPVRENGP